MTSPLLSTKLYIPKWRAGSVSRSMLVGRLSRGRHQKLTLVSAPAGFGKTTLLAEWLSATDRTAAWVSLDQGDNDPRRFWSYVLSALESIAPGSGANALAMLQSPQPPAIEAILTALINDLDSTTGEVVLVLDDLHTVDAAPVHEAIAFLVEHLPPRLHLVIATREDPRLPLHRLRARAQLTELRAVDLRFQPAEAAEFLNSAMGLDLRPADVDALERRTEGWIAGLQLAALSMRGRDDAAGFIRSFAGDDRYIVDYLVEEVLARQPEKIRSFLLSTSVLDRLSGPLCDAVTLGGDGKETLESLERANLFVVPLDDKRRWYRYHHLFADVLRAHAEAEHPELLSVLRRRASAWFEANGMAAEAIAHAHAVGDHQAIARMLVANINELERNGLYTSIARWTASLPDEMVRARPRLAVILALNALRTEPNKDATRRFTSMAEEAIEQIEARGGLQPGEDPDGAVVGSDGLDALKGDALALKLAHSLRDLLPHEAARIADRARVLLPPDRHDLRSMVQMITTELRTGSNDLEAELLDLDESIDRARRSLSPSHLATILSQRAQVLVGMGRLEEGRLAFEEAIAAGSDSSVESSWALCAPHAWLAELLLERNDLAGATEHVTRALDLAANSPPKNFVLFSRTVAVQVFLVTGAPVAALEQLDRAREHARGDRRLRFASHIASIELSYFTRLGELDSAARVVLERGLLPDRVIALDNVEEVLAFAAYLLACGDGENAAALLGRTLELVRASKRIRLEIRALALQALAFEHLQDRASALTSLGRATMLGEPGRFNRTFTSEGPTMQRLLAALIEAIRRGHAPADCGSAGYLASLLADDAAPAAAKGAPSLLAEPLTERELDVLRLVVAGLRNQEIADRLYISLATVKRHIANAYGKLDVRHRTEAVARANELNLL